MTDQRETNSEFQRHEEELNLFLDGELSFDRQANLYSHLAKHPESRSFMDNVMLFRRMSRQEFIAVPPAADDEFSSDWQLSSFQFPNRSRSGS